ncbi:MAG: endonuclease/exonuclease/phosphatase family protein [Patescibacteria group bacterium]
MKVYSWNVLFANRQFDRALAHLARLDFDIFTFQEVPEHVLPRLGTLGCEVAHAVELVRHLGRGQDERLYSVILSRHPIRASARLRFPAFPWPMRTRAFVELMRPFGWSTSSDRGAVYADIEIGNGFVRVFSIHLSLSAPFKRVKEFSVVAESFPEGHPVVICGDLNVIEDPFLKPLNWVLGSPLAEALPWHDERGPFERRFESLGLLNPLLGRVTHPFSRSQLDHILVSEPLSVTAAGVEEERFGSDHRLIWAEITA